MSPVHCFERILHEIKWCKIELKQCVYKYIYIYTHKSDKEDLLRCYQKQNCEDLVLHHENMHTIFFQVKLWRPWSPAALWHENSTPSFPSPGRQPRGTFTVPWQSQAEGSGAHDSGNNSRGDWNRKSCVIRVWESFCILLSAPTTWAKSVAYSASSLPFRHLLKTPLSLLMLFWIGYLRKPQYLISLSI